MEKRGLGRGARGWVAAAGVAGMAWGCGVFAEDVPVARERLAELEARSRRVEVLEAEVRRLESELARARAVPGPSTEASRPGAVPASAGASGWLPASVARSVEKAGPAPSAGARVPEGSVVPMAHVLEHFAADARAALARYQGVKVRFTGVVSDVDKPLFMAPYDVFFRRQETPWRVRVRLMPPSAATRVFVTEDRAVVMAEGGGRREALARVGAAVEFEGTVKGVEGGVVEVKAAGVPKGLAE